jgi:hypothetical protein
MTIKSSNDFYSGLAFLAISVFFSVFSNNYDLGSAAEMGPAYFPTMFSLMLGAVAVALIVKSIAWKS